MAKSPNDYPQIKFRPGAGSNLETALTERVDVQSDGAYSQVAKRDLERYYALLAKSLPQFSEDEALVLAQTLNGAMNRPETIHLLYAEVSSNPDVVDEELDAEFIARLKSLDRFSCMAIADAVERFWSGAYFQLEVRERLKKAGLVKGE